MASWEPIKGEGATYHVKLVGTILTSEKEANLNYSNDNFITLYKEIVSDNHLTTKRCLL